MAGRTWSLTLGFTAMLLLLAARAHQPPPEASSDAFRSADVALASDWDRSSGDDARAATATDGDERATGDQDTHRSPDAPAEAVDEASPAPVAADGAAVGAHVHSSGAGPPVTDEVPPAAASASPQPSEHAGAESGRTPLPTEPAPAGGTAGCGPSQASEPVAPVSSGPASELPPAGASEQRGVEEGSTPPVAPTCPAPE